MISEHEFNSRWRGKHAGILKDLRFFTLPRARQAEMLMPFDWVELHVPMQGGLPMAEMRQAGFFYMDTQINFRIVLGGKRVAVTDMELQARPATDPQFELAVTEWSSFEHERYRLLPGTTQECIDGRYAAWARELVARSPSTCLQFWANGQTQGWFLSQPSGGTALNLTLAVLGRNVRISGFLFYARALEEYARGGYRSGQASFSITHTAVHNIYAQLGARFETPVGIWSWVREDWAAEAPRP